MLRVVGEWQSLKGTREGQGFFQIKNAAILMFPCWKAMDDKNISVELKKCDELGCTKLSEKCLA
jgi:hypothetical protein